MIRNSAVSMLGARQLTILIAVCVPCLFFDALQGETEKGVPRRFSVSTVVVLLTLFCVFVWLTSLAVRSGLRHRGRALDFLCSNLCPNCHVSRNPPTVGFRGHWSVDVSGNSDSACH